MIEHLMYKALFEMSSDRTEFVSRLFSRQHPPSLIGEPSAGDLFKAYSSEMLATGNYWERPFRLSPTDSTIQHGFALAEDDHKVVQHVLETFCAAGPQIDYEFSRLRAPEPDCPELCGSHDGHRYHGTKSWTAILPRRKTSSASVRWNRTI